MGASDSKPSGPQMWKASGPPSVSQDLVESLQSTHESDASRAKMLELQIQSRVAEELKKLQRKESEALSLAQEKLSAPSTSKEIENEPSRYSVGKEVEELRKKLESRKSVRTLPDSVEKARGEVVSCLRENDRRPLDCWQEVENFKVEVKKLEKAWVDKVIS